LEQKLMTRWIALAAVALLGGALLLNRSPQRERPHVPASPEPAVQQNELAELLPPPPDAALPVEATSTKERLTDQDVIKLSEVHTPDVREYLYEEIRKGRRSAALALTRHPSSEARTKVMEFLNDPSLPLEIRNALASGIAMGRDDWSPFLLTTLETAADDIAKVLILSALSNVSPSDVHALAANPKWLGFLHEQLDNEVFILRTHAIIAMGASGDVEELIRRYNAEKDPLYHETYARSLAANGTPEAIQKLLSDPSDDSLRAAALVVPKEQILALIDSRELTEGTVDALYTVGDSERLLRIVQGNNPFRTRALQSLFDLDPLAMETELQRLSVSDADPEIRKLSSELLSRLAAIGRFGGK
jgi:HEAT repeat protein